MPQHGLFPEKASLFLFVLLPFPLAPSFSPNEQANLSCVVSGGFCGRCSGRALSVFHYGSCAERQHKGSWDSEQQASVRHAACIAVSYQKLLRQDVSVFIQICAEEMIYFSSFLFLSLGSRRRNSSSALNKNSLD